MKLKLKKLTLLNFKGIRNLTIDFTENTDISGDNATGKTTIFDAFVWLLFGKDSTDRTQFNIKTLDKNNQVIPKIEHTVIGILDNEGEVIELKRTYNEKWQKKRGSGNYEMTGHETLYYWNDVPLLKKEYEEKINDIIDENIFKLITNPLYFNSLKWEDRRKVLINICGDVTNDEIAGTNKDLKALVTTLVGGQAHTKTVEEYKKEIAARKKKLNDDLKLIPTRIDEATRSKPEQADFDAVAKEVKTLEGKVKKVDDAILDKSKAHESEQQKQQEIQDEIFKHKRDMQNISFEQKQKLEGKENDAGVKLAQLERNLSYKKTDIQTIENRIANFENRKSTIENKNELLREKWEEENAKIFEFNSADAKCPTCNRLFDQDTIEEKSNELKINFNKNKKTTLDSINKGGGYNAGLISDIDQQVEQSNSELEVLNKEKDRLCKDIDAEQLKIDSVGEQLILGNVLPTIKEWETARKSIIKLEKHLENKPVVDYLELQAQKDEITAEIDQKKAILNNETLIIQIEKRILELTEQETNLATQISELEGIENVIDNFDKTKALKLEGKINAQFQYAKFKLFDYQINGAQVDCCETLFEGVPFSDLNNAMKINTGIDIINTLCAYHKVNAPIFADNAEAINNFINTDSQLIKLLVTKDKELVIK